MSSMQIPKVRLSLIDAQLAARWQQVLTNAGCEVVCGAADADVLVTGTTASADSSLANSPQVGSTLATIQVVEELPYTSALIDGIDALLPDSASDRELLQTVRLAARIAELRRQLDHDRKTQASLSRLAMTDPLTGLANRRAWDEQLAACLGEHSRSGRLLCVAILDLDEFKRVNEQFGFAVGDTVLKAAAKAIENQLRGSDLVARVGGDEFGLLLPGVQRSHTEAIAARLRDAVANDLAAVSPVPLTASVGLLVLDEADQGKAVACADELLARADAALRSAKRAGRNQTVTVVNEP